MTGVTWLPKVLLTESSLPLVYEYGIRCLLSCLVGAFGGVVNRIIAERRLAERGETDQSLPTKLAWMHDWHGDAAIGALIGLLVYAGGIPDVSFGKVIVAAAIGGVSGATYFNQRKEAAIARRKIGTESAKSRALKRASEKALGASIRGEGSNGEESANQK